MATSIWDDFKKTLLEGVNVAAEKTEEYTKIGKLKVDNINLNRTLDKTYKALGREIYIRISDGKSIDLSKDDGIQYFTDKINDVTSAIMKNEKKINEIRTEAAKKKKETVVVEKKLPAPESTEPETVKKTPKPKSPKKTAKKPKA